MQVTLMAGCDQSWSAALTPFQRRQLGALYRQGRGLRDRTDHGADRRWAQAGVRYRDSWGNWHRTDRRRGHERVLIRRESYGYTVIFIRRLTTWTIDPADASVTPIESWETVDTWHVYRHLASNLHSPELAD